MRWCGAKYFDRGLEGWRLTSVVLFTLRCSILSRPRSISMTCCSPTAAAASMKKVSRLKNRAWRLFNRRRGSCVTGAKLMWLTVWKERGSLSEAELGVENKWQCEKVKDGDLEDDQ